MTLSCIWSILGSILSLGVLAILVRSTNSQSQQCHSRYGCLRCRHCLLCCHLATDLLDAPSIPKSFGAEPPANCCITRETWAKYQIVMSKLDSWRAVSSMEGLTNLIIWFWRCWSGPCGIEIERGNREDSRKNRTCQQNCRRTATS
jgi:hypothetical protein